VSAAGKQASQYDLTQHESQNSTNLSQIKADGMVVENVSASFKTQMEDAVRPIWRQEEAGGESQSWLNQIIAITHVNLASS
jgi:TRAP-type C4-dicarboxylate transport system substrate-binding protein